MGILMLRPLKGGASIIRGLHGRSGSQEGFRFEGLGHAFSSRDLDSYVPCALLSKPSSKESLKSLLESNISVPSFQEVTLWAPVCYLPR